MKRGIVVVLLLWASVATAHESPLLTEPVREGQLCRVTKLNDATWTCENVDIVLGRESRPHCEPAKLVRLLKGLLPHVGREIYRSTFPFTPGAISMPDTRTEEQRLQDEAHAHDAEAAARRMEAQIVKERNQLVDEARQAVEACQ